MSKKLTLEQRVASLEKSLERFFEVVWKLSDEVAILRKGKNNPQREAMERRVRELENAFFAFQCGAQAQMERDREAIAEAKRAPVREALGARKPAA